MKVRQGEILNNRYKIEGIAGKGGMAFVYRASDLQKGTQVAIKALKEEYMDDAEFVRRFDLEARSAASLSHPNIVKVYGIGEDKGMRYIAQEYIDGHSLKDEINQHGKLHWKIAAPIAIQIALALEHAHERGIIHRDIKPANILLNKEGLAVVTDFGIARAVNTNTVTVAEGNALGSVHYFSPEQAKGNAVNNETDIYSLGVLMYEMLTGQVPFDGDTPVAIAVKHLQDKPIPPIEIEASIPQGMQDIVLRCMQKLPEQRYKSARELIDDLDRFMIDPNGRYGVIHRREKTGTEASLASSTSSDDNKSFEKLVHLEQNIEKRRQSRIRDTVILISFIVLAIVALLLAGNYFIKQINQETFQTTQNTNIFRMPDFTNNALQDVANYLRSEGVNFKVNSAASETIAEGNIIGQNFSPNTEISKDGTHITGNEVILTVSTGSIYTVIPDISNMSLEEVLQLFSKDEYAFVVSQQSRPDAEKEEGAILSIMPKPGTRVKKGERVNIILSSGRNIGPIPDVLKKPIEEAKTLLENSGFAVMIEVSEDIKDEEKLFVLSMTPESGTRNYNGEVILKAGTYQQAFPTPTPVPTTKATTTTVRTTTTATTTEQTTTVEETTTTVETTTTTTTVEPTTIPTTIAETTVQPTTVPDPNSTKPSKTNQGNQGGA